MNKRLQYSLCAVLALIAITFFAVRSERQVISLPPDNSSPLTLPLTNNSTYYQEFIVHENNITAAGIYLRPLAQDLPEKETITLELKNGDVSLGLRQVPVRFIQADSPTILQLNESVSLERGKSLQLHVLASKGISGKVGIIQRPQDDTFNREAVLHTNGEKLSDPAAYVAFSRVRPHITSNIAGLLLIASVLLLLPNGTPRLVAYSLLLPIAALLPILPYFSATLFVLAVFQMVGLGIFIMYRIREGLPLPAVLVGAHAAVFTTFWPLVLLGDFPFFDATILSSISHTRDIFLDPNQVAVMPIGAYIGIPVLLLGLFGVTLIATRYVQSRQWNTLLFFLLIFLGGFVVSPIIPLLTLAYASTNGFAKVMAFLGEDDLYVRVLAYSITVLTLIELWSPYSRALEQLI